MSIILDYFKAHTTVHEYGDGHTFQDIRPKIKCADGFEMSVQGSSGHYCAPHTDGWNFYEVEVGFPTEIVAEILPFAEQPDCPTDSIYGWVPVDIIDAIIIKHGGLIE